MTDESTDLVERRIAALEQALAACGTAPAAQAVVLIMRNFLPYIMRDLAAGVQTAVALAAQAHDQAVQARLVAEQAVLHELLEEQWAVCRQLFGRLDALKLQDPEVESCLVQLRALFAQVDLVEGDEYTTEAVDVLPPVTTDSTAAAAAPVGPSAATADAPAGV